MVWSRLLRALRNVPITCQSTINNLEREQLTWIAATRSTPDTLQVQNMIIIIHYYILHQLTAIVALTLLTWPCPLRFTLISRRSSRPLVKGGSRTPPRLECQALISSFITIIYLTPCAPRALTLTTHHCWLIILITIQKTLRVLLSTILLWAIPRIPLTILRFSHDKQAHNFSFFCVSMCLCFQLIYLNN